MSKGIGASLKSLPLVPLAVNLFVLLSAFIAWQPWKQEITQKIFFPFGVMVLLCLSFFSISKRKLSNWPIGLFLLWSLASVFIHAHIFDNSFTWRYFNFYLMSEGFIHILFAGILFKLIYEYVDNLPCLIVPMMAYLGRAVYIKSLTPIFAVVICVLIYCAIKQRWFFFSWISIATTWFVYSNWQYVVMKAQARIEAWPMVFKELSLVGEGFDKGLMQNMILKINGWGYMHNDFLNLARDLGWIGLGIAVCFLVRFFSKFKIEFLSFACLCVLIICFFQSTLYFPKYFIIAGSLFALHEVRYG